VFSSGRANDKHSPVAMNKSRSYFKLLDALKDPTCPICALLLEDSRTYLDALFYEAVLDVPTRMNLMESFGFCSWHARQVPSLPSIGAPNVGFAIFASDLLRKLDYVGRGMTEERARSWKWKSWFIRKRRGLIAFLKERPCPACDHLRQFELFHLNDFMDAIGDKDFFAGYQGSRGICLPHFLILDETYSSHANFPLLFEVQLAKGKALRNTLEEFIRKQDFRFSDQITSEESRAWKTALEILAGSAGIFANEMEHDLFQRAREKQSPLVEQRPTWSSFLSNGRLELEASLKSAAHVALYLRKPLPEILFQSIRQVGKDSARGTIEAVVEDLPDVGYLRSLHAANFAVFYGIGLPPQTTIIVDRVKGFVLGEDEKSSTWRLRPLKNAEDFSLTMLWHKFGHAVSFHGVVTRRDCAKGLFCFAINGKREQWCRFKDSGARNIPAVRANVEIFGWEKWNTQIVEVLELKETTP
jgi:glycosyltransferase involved in cell wall biosynthesis